MEITRKKAGLFLSSQHVIYGPSLSLFNVYFTHFYLNSE